MGKGAIWIGIAVIAFGLWLTFKLIEESVPPWVLIYPLVIVGTGIGLIVFYKEEDRVEKRKDLKKRKTK